jgi:hypothetical protein
MNGPTRPHRRVLQTACAMFALALSACVSSGGAPSTAAPEAPVSPSANLQPTATADAATTLPPDPAIVPVSASNPSAEANEVFAKCHIGDMVLLKAVTSMGKIASAQDLEHYVPLTGREPQLSEPGPAWIVTVHDSLPQPGSTELWSDPTCVVTDQEFGWFATGPVTDTSTDKVIQPEAPAKPPDRGLPPLAP